MHVEIKMSPYYSQREGERIRLEHELRKWAHKHNIDSSIIRLKYNSDRNVEEITIANDRALELFCFSWPHDRFTLQR